MNQTRPFDYNDQNKTKQNKKHLLKSQRTGLKDNNLAFKTYNTVGNGKKWSVRPKTDFYHSIFSLTPFTKILHYVKGIILFQRYEKEILTLVSHGFPRKYQWISEVLKLLFKEILWINISTPRSWRVVECTSNPNTLLSIQDPNSWHCK